MVFPPHWLVIGLQRCNVRSYSLYHLQNRQEETSIELALRRAERRDGKVNRRPKLKSAANNHFIQSCSLQVPNVSQAFHRHGVYLDFRNHCWTLRRHDGRGNMV